jgi:cell division protein FtsI (penicillin-binding protein 3)/stage V sporulation protein D (sporulation-specific penicillin-binding protein)
MCWRVLFVVFALVVGLTALSLRLIEVQFVKHSDYLSRAAANHTFKREVQARRGNIFDCRGELFATSVPKKTVLADLMKMRQILADQAKKAARRRNAAPPMSIAAIADRLTGVLDLSREELETKLRSDKALVVLKERIERGEWDEVEKLKLPGICSEDVYVRVYPDGSAGSHLIGLVDGEQKGVAGIESAMNNYLRGVNGYYSSERDGKQRELRVYRDEDVPVKNGCDVELSLDMSIQHIVEEELDRAMAKFNPVGAYAVVMRPATGEILAMANRPTYDPNDRGGMVWSAMRNRCVTDTFEPGSTFKIVTTAAAMNEGLVQPYTSINCEGGRWTYCGASMTDHSAYAELTVEQVLQKSSNIGFAKMGLMLGEERMYRYARDFGFGQPVLSNYLPGEQRGKLRPPSRWSKISITRIPIGYEVAATPIQMVTAMSAVANGGKWMRPLVVRELRDDRGKVVARYTPRPIRQVIRPEVSKQVVEALTRVVSAEGTAKLAAVPGYRVAGKTGTSRKWDAEAQAYSHQRYLASFIGFFPAENPEVTILVIMDEPSGKQYYGGQVSAPVFSAIGSRVARHLDIPPTEPVVPAPVAPTLEVVSR